MNISDLICFLLIIRKIGFLIIEMSTFRATLRDTRDTIRSLFVAKTSTSICCKIGSYNCLTKSGRECACEVCVDRTIHKTSQEYWTCPKCDEARRRRGCVVFIGN